MKKKYILFLITAVVFVLAACTVLVILLNKNSGANDVPPVPIVEKPEPVSVITGFEGEYDLNVIECGNGTVKSINDNSEYVLSGEKSLKLSVTDFANAEFSFSENIIEKNICDYDYVSFWVYADYDGVLALGNTAEWTSDNGIYVDSGIVGGIWKKIKITKADSLFDVIKYNLAFNWFTLSAVGKDAGKVVEYDFYIDDVRLYKEGMVGECDMFFAEGENYTSELKSYVAGEAFRLPEICVFSPEGYRIYRSDENVEKQIFDKNGNKIKGENGSYLINKAGKYTFVATYLHDGIQNRMTSLFDVLFVETSDVYGGVHTIGENILIPDVEIFKPGTTERQNGVDVAIEVNDPEGNKVNISDGSFVADVCGKYELIYEITGQVNGVENSHTLETALWVNNDGGLLADFSGGELDMFTIDQASTKISLELAVDEMYKQSSNGNRAALKAVLKDNKAAEIIFSDKFPVKNAEGSEYISMWIYNGSAADLTMEISNSNERAILRSGIWNFAVFFSDSFTGDFRGQKLLLYDTANQTALNGNIYIDNVRFITPGDAEEVRFSSNATTEIYNPDTGEGRRYSVNAQFELDLSIYSVRGEPLAEKAEAVRVVDKRNKQVPVIDGKYFTPTEMGKHTISLKIERDGIINTIDKVIEIGAQILISPDSKFLLTPGEVGKEYALNVMPEVWNRGIISQTSSETEISIYVYDANGQEVELDADNAFIPSVSGKYAVYFIAFDNTGSATLQVSLTVYERDKYGVVADFEDGDPSIIEAYRYYYGDISAAEISSEMAHSGENSLVICNLSDETQSIIFSLSESNIAGDISNSKSFSFWIYVEDITGDNTYYLGKNSYAEWINERDTSYVIGSLTVQLTANNWYEIKVERADFEKVLGGTVFAGATVSLGGSMWTAADNDFITQFYVYNFSRINKNVKIYVDDFTLEY